MYMNDVYVKPLFVKLSRMIHIYLVSLYLKSKLRELDYNKDKRQQSLHMKALEN